MFNTLNGDISENFYRVQSFRYVAGEFFSRLGAQPESFTDLRYRRYLPAVYRVLEEAKDWLDWEAYLRAFSSIEREGWLIPRREIVNIPYPEGIIETDLDHMVLGACLVAHVYDPNKRGLTDENRVLRTRAILMFLLHEADELIAGDKIPEEPDYETAKKEALKPARILLETKYHAHRKLLEIWDEFNAGETELSQNIDFLDHEITTYKASHYAQEMPSWFGLSLIAEFERHYSRQHRDHPDVGFLKLYSLEHEFRYLMGNRYSFREEIKMQREMWFDIKKWGDAMETHEPGLVYELSKSITDQFSAILPE